MTALSGARALLAALVLLLAALGLAAPVSAQLLERAAEGELPVTVEAEHGIEWIRDSKAYVARGNARATRGDTQVKADTLTALYRDKPDGNTEIYRIEAQGNVVISSPRERAVGDRAVYDVDKGSVVLTGENLSFRNAEDVITARDSLEYWESRNMAIARGDATATRTRENQRVQADVLIAHFEERPDGNGSTVSRVEAKGNVVITTPQEVARGREGVYNVAKGTATLVGDVRITRGENQLNGERAVVDLNTGVSRLLPAGGDGRVKGLFIPGTASQ